MREQTSVVPASPGFGILLKQPEYGQAGRQRRLGDADALSICSTVPSKPAKKAQRYKIKNFTIGTPVVVQRFR